MDQCNCADHMEALNRQWTCPVHGERIITRPDIWNIPILEDDEFNDAEFEEVLEQIDRSVKLINGLTKIINRRAA